ncbi:hypothetical protein [Micromonospora sp. NBC_01796]|uniref:hypothetical protein n=1 Tax=Micromonospora sp. NBC_01796 TaxID=2975987 RepID=UPI002DDB441F|nr:hypothetical protein [Micromonospora sp. NBC_01796]WSA83888.1 hypothetical protein OIE47_26435 [Micromonospora sp. NBC_01796]
MSDQIPKAVLTEALRERIGGRRTLAAVFCTFRFEPGFFEQEILPVLFDLPLQQAPAVRRLQLEDALRPLAGQVAVYYDHGALVVGDGTACLDVRRIPVRPTRGYFHPKNAFILLEDEDTGERAVVALTASANLTRAGWWENVECFHLEEIAEGGRSRTSTDIRRFLRRVRTLAKHHGPHDASDQVQAFLSTVQPITQRSVNQVLHPHFIVTGSRSGMPLVDQLDDIAGRRLRGANLEVLSPYLDDADTSTPLVALLDRFQPPQWRILLPEERGLARCRTSLYDWVQRHGGRWGRLPTSHTARGGKQASGAAAAPRAVHAKVYRFFTDDWEITLVGSFNLTSPAHQAGGNVESGVLVEVPTPRRPRFWLEPVNEPPTFAPTSASEDDRGDFDAIPLAVRYDWTSETADVLWDAASVSPPLHVHQAVPLFSLPPLKPATWTALPADDARNLAERLRSSSFLTVVDGDRRAVVLVRETGMAHRPSLLLDLTPAEILRYWSMLNPDQRAAAIAAHGARVDDSGTEALRLPAAKTVDSIFDRFAGMFHGFGSLTRTVEEALADGRAEHARFLIFGAKYDSLPVLLQRVVDDKDGDLVERYLTVLCAHQVVDRIRRHWPQFWASDPLGAARLHTALTTRAQLREQIAVRNDADMVDFLDWYESRFLDDCAEAPA